MNRNPESPMPDSHNPRRKWEHPGVWCSLFCLILLIAVVTAPLWRRQQHLSSEPQIAKTSHTEAGAASVGDPKSLIVSDVSASGQEKAGIQSVASSRPPLILPEPTAASRALVASLTRLGLSSSVTVEQAAEWKNNLLQLVQ